MKIKKSIIMIITILIISISPSYGQDLTGDVNSDGTVDIIDALRTAQHYVGLNPPDFNSDVADTDCNGQVTIVDALKIAQYYVGLVTEFCSSPLATEVEDTKFLYGRGFYDGPFTEEISTATEGAEIVYTLDGSDPMTSGTIFTGSSPLEVLIDPSDNANRPLTPCVTLRAFARKNNMEPTNVDTQTYIFVESVITQGAESPGHGWPDPVEPEASPWPWPGSTGEQALDFGMDPDIVNDPRYRDIMADAMKSIPSFSLVTDLEHLFNETSGIYVNAEERGLEWERPGSAEIIYPNGDKSVQVNAGIRIRGGYHRVASNPKHSFRLFFREEYGDSKLDYKLFNDEGVEEFDKVDLRAATNYNWAFYGDRKNAMVRDVVCRDLQGATNQPYTRSRYYHLYVNGLYWGLFQTQERSEARYATSYFGSEVDDYDVIKSGATENNYLLEATDGTLGLAYELHGKMLAGFESNEAYFNVLGRNPDGSVNPGGRKLVDPENLIDYMINIFYSGDKDGPISTFARNGLNNFYGIINRNNPDGFKWFHHDAEHTLDCGADDRVGPFPNSILNQQNHFNPQTLNEYLMSNAEYRMLFADRAYRHLSTDDYLNDGAYSPAAVTARVNFRASQIDSGGVIGNSARWGDMKSTTPLNYDDHWKPIINTILNSFIPDRSLRILELLEGTGWYWSLSSTGPPAVTTGGAPVSTWRAELDEGTDITLECPAGSTIYYTLDGSDPRSIGGAVSPAALEGGTAITVSLPAEGIKARVLNGSEWSVLRGLYSITPKTRNDLLITEIHYHPMDTDSIDERDFEFIEMRNNTSGPLNLTGFTFTKGILYNFPDGTVIPAGKYIVIAAQPREFTTRYGFEPFDRYNGKLENSGDKLTVRDAFGTTIFSVKFEDSDPWPETPDGDGYSLVPVHLASTEDPDEGTYWTASSRVHGSPGSQDPNTR